MKDSSWGRLIGALVAPGETFRSIAERPTWLLPLLLLTLLGAAVGFVMQSKVDPEELVRGQMGMFKMEVPEEQIEKAIDDLENRSTAATVALNLGGMLFWVALFAFLALLFWVAFKLFGSEVGYKQSFATTLHSFMPLAVAYLLNLPLMMQRESLSFQDLQEGGVLMSSLKALAPEDASAVTEALLGSFDLFTIWTLILLTIGYKMVAKVSTAVASGIVILLWLVYVVGKVGIAAALMR